MSKTPPHLLSLFLSFSLPISLAPSPSLSVFSFFLSLSVRLRLKHPPWRFCPEISPQHPSTRKPRKTTTYMTRAKRHESTSAKSTTKHDWLNHPHHHPHHYSADSTPVAVKGLMDPIFQQAVLCTGGGGGCPHPATSTYWYVTTDQYSNGEAFTRKHSPLLPPPPPHRSSSSSTTHRAHVGRTTTYIQQQYISKSFRP